MTDDREGILGNLPRSRPGVRSDKRGAGKEESGRSGSAAPAPGEAVAPKQRAATKRRTAARPRAVSGSRQATPKPPPPPSSAGGDAIEIAVRAAGQVAETGIKVAARVAGEVLRRLPRP